MRTLGIAVPVLVALLGASPAAAAPPARPVPFLRGVTLGEWGRTAYAPRATRAELGRLRRLGVDAVTMFVVWNQRDGAATRVAPGDSTVPEARLLSAVRAARRAGMRVVLRPYVDRDDGEWRGLIRPASLDAWFRSYGEFVLRYARLAGRERAAGLVVGSEMISLSPETARWRALIRRVRRVFHGFVTYQANWDEVLRVGFWRDLDAISVSAYYPLTQQPDPTVDDLVAGWREYVHVDGVVRRWFDELDFVRRRTGRPVVFGEIGYRTVRGTARAPWDTSAGDGASTQAQADAYEAAFRVWYRVPWFRGFAWWYVAPQDALVRGLPGADHRPAAPARAVLRRWYRSPR